MYLLNEISLKIQWVSSSNVWAKVMKKLNKSMFACSGFSNLKQIAFWTLTAHWLLNSCNKVLWYKYLWHLSREIMFCDSRIAPHFTCWVGVEQTSIFSCSLQFQNCGSHGKTLTCGTEDLTQIFAFLLCSTFFAIRTKKFKRWNAVLFFIGAVLGCKLIQYCFHRSWNTPKCAAAPKNDPSMARGRGALYPLPNLILIRVLFPLSIHSCLCGLWSISHPQEGWIKGIYDTTATAHGRFFGPGGGRAVLQEAQVVNQNIPTVWCSWEVILNLRSLFHWKPFQSVLSKSFHFNELTFSDQKKSFV